MLLSFISFFYETGPPMPQLSLHSPLGVLTITEDQGYIVSLDWGEAMGSRDRTPLLKKAAEQVQAYFDGDLKNFDLPLMPEGTSYRRKVWQALQDIPYGKTMTYGALAAKVGGSARSIGQANHFNPIPIIIPCHRVIGSNGALGGYSGLDGVETKRYLLSLENPDPDMVHAASPCFQLSLPRS
ncbi:O6-methylguanine-DNA methyltransferase [Granulibacter bethesdensis]|uniref:Methylated-DNA--protein-cysteine methyltransferase n=2 Tax=Granulibacter bethesdensis TaxID=364410 RepID=A0AAC9K8B8_9PROT|nr:O6-methylguanine-DNA methyltransferase [Granulibacter bethesdensis]APH60810.1 O6-methylguanine-DNA methyltransferase [Granulibacter bethesdensis]